MNKMIYSAILLLSLMSTLPLSSLAAAEVPVAPVTQPVVAQSPLSTPPGQAPAAQAQTAATPAPAPAVQPAAPPRWIFTTLLPSKEEIISIQRKEFCRPFEPTLMNTKCAQYKQGFVCPSQKGSFVISAFDTKKECERNLKKAKNVLAKR